MNTVFIEREGNCDEFSDETFYETKDEMKTFICKTVQHFKSDKKWEILIISWIYFYFIDRYWNIMFVTRP